MRGESVDGAGPSGSGRIMALDYGDRRIGVALSDPLGITARPLLTLTRTTWESDLERIRTMTREHDVRRIVVGLPLDMDGTRGERVRLTEVFMERVRRATGIPVHPWDERLTTLQAERALLEADLSRTRRRRVIDQVAAVILLQSYLDAQQSATAPG